MLPRYIETVVRHHAWAVERLLDTSALLTPAQLQTGALSHGTLLATLRHVADVDQSWGRSAQGRASYEVERMEEELVDLPSLRSFWLAEAAQLVDFVCSLAPADLDRDIQPPSKTQASKKTWQVLLHISNHRAEHGNEIGWRLTALGHSPGEMGLMHYLNLQRRGVA